MIVETHAADVVKMLYRTPITLELVKRSDGVRGRSVSEGFVTLGASTDFPVVGGLVVVTEGSTGRIS